MRYFVTGATGFVGSHVVRRLRQDGHEVAALVRSPDKARELAGLGVEMYQGDVAEKESMRAGMRGADGVFHIAGWYKYGPNARRIAERVNVEGTRNVLALMQELGIPKGVYTSTLAVNSCTGGPVVDETYRFDGRHISVYDETKARAHRIAEDFIAAGLPLVIVMPGVIYGPGDTSLIRPLLVGLLKRRIPALEPSMSVTWVYIDDVADAHILAMEKGALGETYITTGPPHSVGEVADLIQELSGVRMPMQTSVGMQRGLSRVMGLVEKFVQVPEMYCSEYLSITSGRYYLGDNSKARRELGFKPRPLREGLKTTLQHEMALLGMEIPDPLADPAATNP